MRKSLLSITAVIVLSATAPAYAANSYQEVAENHASALRANEKVEARTESLTSSVTNSFQDVIEKNKASTQSIEIQEDRMVVVDSIAPTSIQDAVFGDHS